MFSTIFRNRGLVPDPGQRAGDVPDAAAGAPPRRRWILHPFLIACFPILALYSHNVYETTPRAMVIPSVLALVGTLAIWLMLRLLTRDGQRAGLVTSLFLTFFFAFNYVTLSVEHALDSLSVLWVHRTH